MLPLLSVGFGVLVRLFDVIFCFLFGVAINLLREGTGYFFFWYSCLTCLYVFVCGILSLFYITYYFMDCSVICICGISQ